MSRDALDLDASTEQLLGRLSPVSWARGPRAAELLAETEALVDRATNAGRHDLVYELASAVSGALIGRQHRDAAITWARRALDAARKADGQGDVGRTLAALGRLARRCDPLHGGDAAEANSIAREALALAERHHGPDSIETARQLGLLADVRDDDPAAHREALTLYARAIGIIEAIHGPDDPLVAKMLEGAALAHRILREYGDAVPLYERAVAIVERACETGHCRTGMVLEGLGETLVKAGRAGDAVPVLERALAMEKPADEQFSLGEVLARWRLAWALQEAGRAGEALPHLERALSVLDAARHPGVTLMLLEVQVPTLHDLGDTTGAASAARRALALASAQWGETAEGTIELKVRLRALLDASA